MRRSLLLFMLSLFVAVASCSFTTKTFNNPDKDKLLIDLISYVLQRSHYDAKKLDDNFSKEVFEDYIEALDPLKRYFYQSDIEEFKAFEDKIDDQINNKELTFFDLTYSRLQERMQEAEAFYKDILKGPIDFGVDETINTDFDELTFVNNKEELYERWRMQLKFNELSNFYDKYSDQQAQLEKEPSERAKDFEEKDMKIIEEEARETTRNAYKDYFVFNEDLERKDWFSIFLNAIVEEFDPHTYYFAPTDKDRFDISMSGKLEGIGARLQKKSENIKIIEVISGGPAWRGNEIEEGDLILKVKQEGENEPVSIIGMRLDDAVELIKGPKGTKVTLTVKKKIDANIKDVTIVRDIVELEETYAKSSLVNKNDSAFGIINLPKFYFDMQNYGKRNAAMDVKKEIIRLKAQDMQGLVIDLRNNGGGSLQTVVEIAGLFIKKGPIVQVKFKERAPEVLTDSDESILWDGPLVILVNELSASASEILAAAMQDYKRAIILGSKQTYGKGTVQNVNDLNGWVRNNEYGDLGALKLTTQKFYRVNGGSTQLEGVKSDVVVPDRYSYVDIGEKDQENPLAWDKIEAANYKIWEGTINFEETIKNSKERMAKNKQLQLIDENARWVKEKRDVSSYSLNFEKYKADIEENERQAKRFDAIDAYETSLTYASLPYEIAAIQKDTILAEKRQRWHESLSKDVYVEEAIHVLEDMKSNTLRKVKLTAKD